MLVIANIICVDNIPTPVDYRSAAYPPGIEIEPHLLGVRFRFASSPTRIVISIVLRASGGLVVIFWLWLRWILGPGRLTGTDYFWLTVLFSTLAWLIASIIRAACSIGRPLVLEASPGMLILHDPLRFRTRWIAADDIIAIGVTRLFFSPWHHLMLIRRRSGIPAMFPGRWKRHILANSTSRQPLEQAAAALIAALGTPTRPWQPTKWWNV